MLIIESLFRPHSPSNLCAQLLARAYNPQPQELVESNRMHLFPYTNPFLRYDRTVRRQLLCKTKTKIRARIQSIYCLLIFSGWKAVNQMVTHNSIIK